jgi:hypothetical protein
MGREARAPKSRKRATPPATAHDTSTPEIDDLLGITPGAKLHIVSAREKRSNQTLKIIIGPGEFVMAKRMDMTAMLFNGEMPLTITSAAHRLKKMKDAPADQRLEMIGDPENVEVLEMLRTHASQVVYDPKVVWPDDGVDDHMPASLFTLPQLMKIWTETALVPAVSPADAWRFRQRPTAVHPAPVPAREDVRETSESVDTDDEPVIHG